MKMMRQWLLASDAVSFLRAWDMSLAWSAMWESPISPSSSALGTRAATESTTTTSTPPERTMVSTISRACSPVSGWLRYRASRLMPRALA
jgi:hypothetical protein